MTQWEYCLASLAVVAERAVPLELRLAEALSGVESRLDELGEGGWEAVGPVTVSSLRGNDQKQATVLLFKRPVEPEPAPETEPEPEDAVPPRFVS